MLDAVFVASGFFALVAGMMWVLRALFRICEDQFSPLIIVVAFVFLVVSLTFTL